MSLEMKITEISSEEDSPKVKHAREVDRLKQQCDVCDMNRPKTPTKDCAIKHKLVINDSEVGWKHKHLFLHTNGHCKMFKEKR